MSSLHLLAAFYVRFSTPNSSNYKRQFSIPSWLLFLTALRIDIETVEAVYSSLNTLNCCSKVSYFFFCIFQVISLCCHMKPCSTIQKRHQTRAFVWTISRANSCIWFKEFGHLFYTAFPVVFGTECLEIFLKNDSL